MIQTIILTVRRLTAASLRFSLQFDGAFRRVYLKSEAYFAMTKEHQKPRKPCGKCARLKFIVNAYERSGRQEIQNIGLLTPENDFVSTS